MSLLGDLAGSMLGGGGAPTGLMGAALSMLNSQEGGIGGLAQMFEAKGLGAMAQSWIGNGENAPVSGQQLESVLGSDMLKGFAEKAGISHDQASGQLASILPGLIDKLTHTGVAPAAGTDLLSLGMKLLSGK